MISRFLNKIFYVKLVGEIIDKTDCFLLTCLIFILLINCLRITEHDIKVQHEVDFQY